MSSKLQNYIAEKKKEKKPLANLPMEEEVNSPLEQSEIVQIIRKLKGKDGKNPSSEELVDMIKSLMITPKDGHTPTKFELLNLIKPLIPKPIHGKTPKKGEDYFTKEEAELFLRLATPIKGKHYFDGTPGRPGKDAIMPDLRELAISAINILEMFEGEDRLDVKAIKGIEKLIKKIISEEWLQYYTGPGNGPTTQTYGTGGFTYINEIVSGSGTTFTLAHVPQNGANVVIFGGGILY